MSPALAQKIPSFWTAPAPETGWSHQPRLRESLRYCAGVTRHHAKSFFFSSFPLPREKRLAAFAIYAFCRHIDDIIDASADAGTGAALHLAPGRDTLARDLAAIAAGSSPLPFAPAFAEVNRQYSIPSSLYLDLIEGCCRDREPVRILTFPELEDYCYHVASVVGLMMSKIFCLRDPAGLPHAVDLGIAMQLTNILRDIAEDFAMGRIYLPADELAAFQLTPADFAARRMDSRWSGLLQMQIARARDYYRRGCAGLSFLPDDGSRTTAHLMARIYSGILEALEARGLDPFRGRVFVPTARKIRLALAVVFS